MRLELRPFLALAVVFAVACGGKTESESTDAGGTCRAGEKQKQNCNTCTCDSRGQWSCTLEACVDASADSATCTPGQTRKLDCNSCTCMPNGEWACTGLACSDAGLDPRCPATWSAASTGSHDDLCPEMLACNYAEGSCTCPAYCGGPPPGPDWKPTWTCTPKPPPRMDGCPEAELIDGATCTTAGKVCSYGSCCMNQYECVSGTWRKSGPICPP